MEELKSVLDQLGQWTWLFIAVALFVFEILVPGVFLLWFAIAALIVGIVVLAVDISLTWQLIIFGLASLASVFIGAKLYNYGAKDTTPSKLNLRGEQYVGRIFQLVEPIENGRGAIKVADTVWRVEGPDMAAGQTVRVTGTKGTVLLVEAA